MHTALQQFYSMAAQAFQHITYLLGEKEEKMSKLGWFTYHTIL
jgi:hypothetical protein